MLPFLSASTSQRNLIIDESDDEGSQQSDDNSELATFCPHDNVVDTRLEPAVRVEAKNTDGTESTEEQSELESLAATVGFGNLQRTSQNDDEDDDERSFDGTVASQFRRSTRAREMVKKLVNAQLAELKAHLPEKVFRQHSVRVNCLQNMVLTALRRLDEQKEKMEEMRHAKQKEFETLSHANSNLVQEVEVMEQETNQVKQELIEACKVIDSLSESLRERNQELASAQELVEELESQINELDQELNTSLNQTSESALQVEARQNVLLANAQSEIDVLKTERDDFKTQLEFYKKRCAQLEKMGAAVPETSNRSMASSKSGRFWRFGKKAHPESGDELSDMSSIEENSGSPKGIDPTAPGQDISAETIQKLLARIEKLEGGSARKNDTATVAGVSTTLGFLDQVVFTPEQAELEKQQIEL